MPSAAVAEAEAGAVPVAGGVGPGDAGAVSALTPKVPPRRSAEIAIMGR